MGLNFDWTTNDEEHQEAVLSTVKPNGRSLRPFLVFIVLVAVLGLLGWIGYQTYRSRALVELRKTVQLYQQIQEQAITSENGELFRSVNANTPSWISTQLQPVNWRVNLLKPTILTVEPHPKGIITSIQWREDSELLQRVIFYAWRETALVQAPLPIDYWGNTHTIQQPWGQLKLSAVDRPWANEIGQFTSQLIDQVCTATCRSHRLPLTLTIHSSFSTTAAPQQVAVPSPRLLALNAQAEPAPLFWHELEQQIVNQLATTKVRFAAPAHLVDRIQQSAKKFMLENPTIQVEIVALETLSDDPIALFAAVDGAFFSPTVGMITSGLIHDLSDFAATDPQIKTGDFEPRIWQAAHWQNRLWLLPQAATMQLIFYDRSEIKSAGLDTLDIDEWVRFTDLLGKMAEQPRITPHSTVLFDLNADLLVAYVAHLHCAKQQWHQKKCWDKIEQATWAAGLEWYRAEVVTAQTIMNLSDRSAAEREQMAIKVKSLPLRTVLWTEHPTNFEHYQQLHMLGVTSFPGAKGKRALPLRLHGSVISQQAANPRATWQWITYLTFERPLIQTRDIPVRRSVATAMGFWSNLPEPIGTLMRDEFVWSRPILIEEEMHLEWQNLSPLMKGDITANISAQAIVDPSWFTFIPRTFSDEKQTQ